MNQDIRSAPQLRILVVDDEFLIRWSITEALTAAGHVVMAADCAATALAVLAAPPLPDVMVVDYRLPDSADLTLLSRLRETAPCAAVIFMTAFGARDVIDGALRRGAYQVLTKPIDIRDLPALVLDAHAARPQ